MSQERRVVKPEDSLDALGRAGRGPSWPPDVSGSSRCYRGPSQALRALAGTSDGQTTDCQPICLACRGYAGERPDSTPPNSAAHAHFERAAV
jgi:hypothetical protein